MAYEFVKDRSVDWEIITPHTLESATRELAAAKVFSADTEGSGLKWHKGDHIIGHSFAHRRSNGQIRAIYLPVRHRGMGAFDVVKQLDPTHVNDAIRPALTGPALKCGHNFGFDVGFYFSEGIEICGPVHDTMVAAQIANENHRSYRLPLCLARDNIVHERGWKSLIQPDLKAQAKMCRMKLSEFKTKHGYEFVSVDRLGVYACQDATYELRLAEYQFAICGQWPDTWAMEMELFWVCADMARVGVPINPQVLYDLAEEQTVELASLSPRIWTLAGEEFDIAKDDQTRRILFNKLGYASRGLTRKAKLDRVDDDALWSLEKHDGSEIAGLIRRYNKASKIVSTYTMGIIEHAGPDNIIHGVIRQGGAATGRVSMGEPNCQNIPIRTELGRRVRSAFIARPGKIRYCNDYCLTGDTEIITVDGVQSIRDVVRLGLDVLSCSPEGELAFKKLERGAQIGTKPVVELELDDGTIVCCTSDHEWMRLDGSKAKTSALKPGDRLRHVRQGRAGRYPTWWWRCNREYVYCHRVAAEHRWGACPTGYEVDHIDNDVDNWLTSNVIYRTISDNRGEAAGNWWALASPKQRAAKSRQLVAGQVNRRSYEGSANPNYGKRKGLPTVCARCGVEFYRPPSHGAKYCSRKCFRGGNNYRVVAVRPVGDRVVYHLTVADWHTFVLSNGLVSGNSQIELRVLAHLSQDPLLLKVYHEGLDVHATTSIEAFGTAGKVNGVDMRRVAKCFHPDTEVLSRTGWVRIVDLTQDQEVAQAMPGSRGRVALGWVVPTEVFTKPNRHDHLIHLRTEGIDLRVTPDHRMVGWGVSGDWSVRTPVDFTKFRYWANAGTIASGNPVRTPEAVLRLAVATQADGSYTGRQIRFGFTKPRKISRFRSMLSAFPGEWREGLSSQGVTTFVVLPKLASRIKRLLTGKSLSWSWLSFPPVLRLAVLDEARHWDAHKARNWRMYSYGSTDKQSAEVLQALASISGCKSRLTTRRIESGKLFYSVSIRARSTSRGGCVEFTKLPYTGTVACLSVPSSFVLVRDGGVPVITGQTLNFGIPFGITEIGVMKNINKDLPDGVDEIVESAATAYLNSWYGKYTKVDSYRKCLWRQAAQNGGLVFDLFGRPRRIPDICAREDWKRRAAQRQLTSSLVQGSAASMVKRCMIACHHYLKSQQDCDADMVLMVHDDLQFDMAPEGSAKTQRALVRIMEDTCQHALSVPIVADTEYFTDHWGNKKKM